MLHSSSWAQVSLAMGMEYGRIVNRNCKLESQKDRKEVVFWIVNCGEISNITATYVLSGYPDIGNIVAELLQQ